jgi:hypothetical protein
MFCLSSLSAGAVLHLSGGRLGILSELEWLAGARIPRAHQRKRRGIWTPTSEVRRYYDTEIRWGCAGAIVAFALACTGSDQQRAREKAEETKQKTRQGAERARRQLKKLGQAPSEKQRSYTKMSMKALQGGQKLSRELNLVRIQFPRPAKPHSPVHCGLTTCPGSFTNQIALKLCDTGKHSHDHFAGVSRRVGPRF